MDKDNITQWFKKDPNLGLPIVSIKNTACPCRKAKGLTEGWCGVAGGGVPACDH